MESASISQSACHAAVAASLQFHGILLLPKYPGKVRLFVRSQKAWCVQTWVKDYSPMEISKRDVEVASRQAPSLLCHVTEVKTLDVKICSFHKNYTFDIHGCYPWLGHFLDLSYQFCKI